MNPSTDIDVSFSGDDLVLRLASAAYLARFTGTSRIHCGSDLRIYFGWCAERGVAPMTVSRPEVERYVRCMQEVRRFKAATVARRMAVVIGFYRTCVIDGVIEHSPAEIAPPDGLRRLAETSVVRLPRMHPHMLRHTYVTTMLDAGVGLRDVQIARPTRRPPHHDALRPRTQEPRPPLQLHPRRLYGLRHMTSQHAEMPNIVHHGPRAFHKSQTTLDQRQAHTQPRLDIAALRSTAATRRSCSFRSDRSGRPLRPRRRSGGCLVSIG